MTRTQCPNCGNEAALVTGREVLPGVSEVAQERFLACLPCDMWVGCHSGTETPMGRLAGPETRRLKREAHAAFDPIWQSGSMSRTAAYKWLAHHLGLSKRACHIGWMSDDDLRRVVEMVRAEGGADA